MNDFAIPIVWASYPIEYNEQQYKGLGHAGVVIVDGSTGGTRYFEYGRYGRDDDGNSIGLVRSKPVGNITINNGVIDGDSLINMVSNLSANAGKGTPATGTILPLKEGGYEDALEYANSALNDPNTVMGEYSFLNDNHCYTFAKNVAAAGGSWIDWFDGFGFTDNIPSNAMLELMANRGGFVVGNDNGYDFLVGNAASYATTVDFDNCFPAGTLITVADGTTKPIEHIRHGDIVLSHDKNGNLVPAIVDKLFTNTTDAFIRLSFTDGREDLIATPGHHFLTETGDYMEIGHMARLGGGNLRLVDTDGSIISATAERLEYSAETADLFEQSQTKTIAFSGNTALKEDVSAGWKTYNFEVRETHTYIAGGVRVHNTSVLDFMSAYEFDHLKELPRDTDNDGKWDSATIVAPDGIGEYPGMTGLSQARVMTELMAALEMI